MKIGRPGLFVRLHARLHDERGFTMVEAMVAGFVLAIGAFAVANSLQYGLYTSGIARQRTAAEQLANQQLELARALNYDNVILRNDVPIVHSSDPSDPDYWVNDGPPMTYDPDGSGGLSPEPILSDNVTPSLLHYQAAIQQGKTTFTIYTYVTWVDSPLDGTVAAGDDAADGNQDGIDDSDGHDQKRVTIVAAWPNSFGSLVNKLTISSIFSDGKIPYHGDPDSGPNQVPSVTCPSTSTNNLDASFTAQATDTDGSIVRIDWDFGDLSTIQSGGTSQSHTYASAGTYTVTNTVFDDDGGTASNATQNCQVTVTDPPSPGPDSMAPSGTIVISNGATYATTVQVTLTLSATDDPGGTGVATMQFSDNGSSFGAAVP
jgi:PKD repeat protein